MHGNVWEWCSDFSDPNCYQSSPPHWRPSDENVTVLQGTFRVGRGEKFDKSAGKELPAGSFARMPKGMRHFVWAEGETIIQVQGIGPFDIHYVNPGDDPRKKSR